MEQTEEYKDLALLERVNLGDTVTVEYPSLGVSATARCVKTVYDVLKDRYESIELGQLKSNIAGTIANQQQQIQDFPNSTVFQQAVDNANGWITNGQKGEMVAIQKNGKWVEIASLDTGDIATAQSVWRWNNGGFGHSNTGYNGDFITALTADGKINASMILVGELWANLIKAGRIQGRTANGPYFDLDANNGQGELAASILKGVGDGSTTTARIGFGTYAGGGTYEGMRINTASGAGSEVIIAMQREQGDYTLANDAELMSLGNLVIRSQGIVTNPGGNNSINMTGNSTTGEGIIRLRRGRHDGASDVLFSDKDRTYIQFTSSSGKNTWIELTGNRIGFGTDGVERGSLDANGWHGQGTTNG